MINKNTLKKVDAVCKKWLEESKKQVMGHGRKNNFSKKDYAFYLKAWKDRINQEKDSAIRISENYSSAKIKFKEIIEKGKVSYDKIELFLDIEEAYLDQDENSIKLVWKHEPRVEERLREVLPGRDFPELVLSLRPKVFVDLKSYYEGYDLFMEKKGKKFVLGSQLSGKTLIDCSDFTFYARAHTEHLAG